MPAKTAPRTRLTDADLEGTTAAAVAEPPHPAEDLATRLARVDRQRIDRLADDLGAWRALAERVVGGHVLTDAEVEHVAALADRLRLPTGQFAEDVVVLRRAAVLADTAETARRRNAESAAAYPARRAELERLEKEAAALRGELHAMSRTDRGQSAAEQARADLLKGNPRLFTDPVRMAEHVLAREAGSAPSGVLTTGTFR